jgi:hypothetical protein
MDIFKTITLEWWQTGLLKIGLISLGILIGLHWPRIRKYYWLWWALFLIPSLYILYVWFQE